MKEIYETTLIVDDFKGDKQSVLDCIGARAFKRASGGIQILWCIRMGTVKTNYSYTAYHNNSIIDLMGESYPGMKIKFKKDENC